MTTYDTSRLLKARIAASLLFLTNGAIFANLLPRLPEVKDMFELSNATYGLALIALPVGGVLAGPLPAPILRKFGSARTAALGSVLLAVCIAMAGSFPLVILFWMGMFMAGVLDAIVDTAQNAQGLKVQRLLGKSIINSMHALWSVGAVIGGLMGTFAAAHGFPLPLHLAVSGLLFACVALFSQRWTVPDSAAESPVGHLADSENDDTQASEKNTSPTGSSPVQVGFEYNGDHTASSAPRLKRAAMLALFPIAVVAAAGVLVEDIGINWAAVYSRDVLGAPLSIAGLGFVCLVGAQFVGRLLGDRLINALGEVNVTRLGGAAIFVGLGAVVLAPAIPVAFAGFAIAGFGCATMVPSAYAAADRAPGLRPGAGLTLLSWCTRIVFLASPPIVGLVADAVGLRMALMVFPLFGIMAFFFAGALRVGKKTAV